MDKSELEKNERDAYAVGGGFLIFVVLVILETHLSSRSNITDLILIVADILVAGVVVLFLRRRAKRQLKVVDLALLVAVLLLIVECGVSLRST